MFYIIVTYVTIISKHMARPTKETTPNKVVAHRNGGHTYAATRPLVRRDDGTKYNKTIHWGTLENGNKFVPNLLYLMTPIEERKRLIFPDDWDMGEVVRLESMRGPGRPAFPEAESTNRFYGDIWLLERIAEETGIREDLMDTFSGNAELVDQTMTLAMFPYLTRFSYDRVARWQRIAKAPSDTPLTPGAVTRLTQGISESHRMRLFSLRAKRVKAGTRCAIDSTSVSAYGGSLADIHWGKNKEGVPLPQTNEVVVYALDDHMPIYYRSFPGNMPDARALDVIHKDMDDAGFGRDIVDITDRGYHSVRNIEHYIRDGRAVIMAVKTNCRMVLERIDALGEFGAKPDGMRIDPGTGYYFRQYDIPYSVVCTNGKEKAADRLRLNLYFDPEKRGRDQRNLDLDMESQRAALEHIMSEGLAVDDDVASKDFRLFVVDTDGDGHVKSFSPDEKRYAAEMRTSGFFANLTHKLDLSPHAALEHYSYRDEQEKYFMTMKTQMVSNRQRCWSEEGKAGRQLILFVALTLASRLKHVWKSNEELKKLFPTTSDILDEMRSIRCIEHPHHAKTITPFVGNQLLIAKVFGFDIPKGCEPDRSSIQPKKKRGRPKKTQT